MSVGYDAVLKQMKDIHDRKNHDYGDSASSTFKAFGMTAYLVRLSDKLNRAIALSRNIEQQVPDEKLYDTLLDMANYAAMAAGELDVSKG